MTSEQKNEVARLYNATCKVFDKVLDADVLKMQVEDLADLPFEKVMRALIDYRRNAKNTTWPRANKIREIINPKIDTKDLAVELSRKIDKAISKFGWGWSEGVFINGETYFLGGGKYHWTFKDAVIAELGEIGWHVIATRGWIQLRNSANEMNEGVFIAQLQNQVQSSLNLASQGVDITKIELPSSKKKETEIAFDFSKNNLKEVIKI